jgi:transglutaminase-like putative cysteine protease
MYFKSMPTLALTLLVASSIVLPSCQSCSRSGRGKLIETAMAKRESNREATNPTPETIKNNNIPGRVNIDDVVTPNEKSKINKQLIEKSIPPAKGELIQVEGLILKEVNELTIDLKTSDSQLEQIFAMNKYVHSKWHYVYDPYLATDTWRSAEATLSLKYNGKYSGDCDDFAILMASFARQIGLDSRMVGAFDSDGNGHAFAEFFLPAIIEKKSLSNGKDYRTDSKGKWISLDWFKGSMHEKYNNNLKVFDDI